jgi:hypothetical protein
MQDFASRMGIMSELMQFLWKRKLYWLIPMIATLMIFAVLIVLSQSSAIAPFLYTLF